MLVFFGFLITLNVMGINLTSLVVLLGGLGVGIGFGLQNIANNFVSGLLLLLERPVRTGDIINISGQHEGEVTRLGMRSLTVKTWDKKDVIVPNSELISNAFINWTRSDNILRTTLYIGVSYDDDPHKVKELIAEVLEQQEELLSDPPVNLILWDFGDSAVTFRIDYYQDIRNSSIFKVRDRILFMIWDVLKEHQITIPYPQRDVHVYTSQVTAAPPNPS